MLVGAAALWTDYVLLSFSSQMIDLITAVAMLLLWTIMSASSSVYSSTWYLVAAKQVNSTETEVEVEVQRHIPTGNAWVLVGAIGVLVALRLCYHPPAWALQIRAWIMPRGMISTCCRRRSRVAT